MRGLGALLLAGLGAACTSSKADPCGAIIALGTAAQSNGAACSVDGGIPFVPEGLMGKSTFPISAYAALGSVGAACDALFDAGTCTPIDAATLSGEAWAQQDCFAGAGVCTAGNAQAWMTNLLSCLEQTNGCCNPTDLSMNREYDAGRGISPGCTAALLDAGVL